MEKVLGRVTTAKIEVLLKLWKEEEGYKKLISDEQDRYLLEKHINKKVEQLISAKSIEEVQQISNSCKVTIQNGKSYYIANKYCTQEERYFALRSVTNLLGSDPVTEKAIATLKKISLGSMDKRKAV